MAESFAISCPLPITRHKNVVLGHGSGGRLTAQLVREMFLPAFDNPLLRKLDDQAVLEVGGSRVAFTTDSFVVTPLFFPGGNIGELAVNGTVNDLAMSGAMPLGLSAAFIVEEGLPMEELARVVDAMAQAARAAAVPIVTGDTKVVNRHSADKLFVTTTGIGLVPAGLAISASNVRPGDVILLSGTIADHGIAVMAQREAIDIEGEIRSDTQALHRLVAAMIAAGEIHALRDPTRGGLGASLCEIADSSGIGVEIDARTIAVRPEVSGACELLGIDPLFVANEGKLVAFAAPDTAQAVLSVMRGTREGKDAVAIGRAVEAHPGMVVMKTEIGGTRIVDLPFHEQLPRIC
jgi:hydrogenase expression/formation protein HypE